MKLQRFFGDFDLTRRTIRISDRELLNQLKNVFRFGSGDKIVLADGRSGEALVEIKSISRDFAECEPLEISRNQNETALAVSLYCSVLKRENFEWVLQKATEVGVKEIVPVISERTVKLALKSERLEKIIREAAEQSGRGMVPILKPIISFEESLAAKHDLKIIFDGAGESLAGISKPESDAGIWIGPEGGWMEGELELAQKSGCRVVSLGKLTLRAETAAVVAPFAVLNLL